MGLESHRSKSYNCRLCQESGQYEKRNCFLFGDEIQEIETAYDIVDDQTNKVYFKKGKKYFVDTDGIDELVIRATDLMPDQSPFKVLIGLFPKVCPKSIITPEINEILSMESFCREYHLSPLGPISYEDYPLIFVETMGHVRMVAERVRAGEQEKIKAKSS